LTADSPALLRRGPRVHAAGRPGISVSRRSSSDLRSPSTIRRPREARRPQFTEATLPRAAARAESEQVLVVVATAANGTFHGHQPDDQYAQLVCLRRLSAANGSCRLQRLRPHARGRLAPVRGLQAADPQPPKDTTGRSTDCRRTF